MSVPTGTVALFATCINDMMFPDTPKAVLRLLERLGCTVDFPLQQTCCGQMFTNTGYFKQAMPSVRNFVDTRWTVAEFLMPVMILVMAGSMITLSMGLVAASNVILLSIWVLFAAAVIQTWFLWRGFKRLLAER